MEDMTGRCFHCGKEGHQVRDPEYPMYDVNDLLNQQWGSQDTGADPQTFSRQPEQGSVKGTEPVQLPVESNKTSVLSQTPLA